MDKRAKTPIVLDYASQPAQRGPYMRWMLVFGATTLTLILAALGSNLLVPRFGLRTLAKVPAAKMMVGPNGSIVMAIESFHDELGTYPEIVADLCTRPSAIDLREDSWYQFLSDCSFTDPWGNPLVYLRVAEGGDGYVLLSCGPDGKPDTDDDVANHRR